MNRHELLKKAGYSDEFINSLNEYEKTSKKRIQIQSSKLISVREEVNSIDSNEYEFTLVTNDDVGTILSIRS